MKAGKAERLRRAGWTTGSVAEFLGLDEAESAYVDIRAALAEAVASRRRELRLTQTVAARRVRSSQSRMAKMEHADPSVSLDLLIRSLLTLGATRREIGAAVASAGSPSRRQDRARRRRKP